jgi:tRNA A-37 threonylcarbamoyl transferase component Bud32
VTPAGYKARLLAGGTWIVRSDLAGVLPEEALADLLGGAARRAAGPGRGRGAVAPVEFAGLSGVGKRSRHGGLLGSLLGGIYWGTARITRPIDLARRLRGAAVRTPEVLAAGWRRVAGPLHAHALVTEAIPGAVNLHEVLLGAPPATTLRAVGRAAADTVRAMHDANFKHADLSLANLVLEDSGGEVLAHVVDLDRGRFVHRLSAEDRAANLARLLRSHEKWVAAAAPLRTRDALWFLWVYCRGDDRLLRDLLGRIRRRGSWMWLRRIAWGRRHDSGASRLARPAQQR